MRCATIRPRKLLYTIVPQPAKPEVVAENKLKYGGSKMQGQGPENRFSPRARLQWRHGHYWCLLWFFTALYTLRHFGLPSLQIPPASMMRLVYNKSSLGCILLLVLVFWCVMLRRCLCSAGFTCIQFLVLTA